MDNPSTSKLFSPIRIGRDGDGPITLSHRIVLAPLTRNRATEPSLCPHNDHVEYYSQRATKGGLLITEAVNISPEAVGYVSVPGIWTEEQTSAWRAVTNSVHAKGGKIFMQLWHTGRVAHPSFSEHPLLRKKWTGYAKCFVFKFAIATPKTQYTTANFNV